MNIENVNKAIDVMERVKARGDNFDLSTWQGGFDGGVIAREEDLHACGTSACFAGWVAVSPEFQADGGEVNFDGSPQYSVFRCESAIREWLNLPHKEADDMCGMRDSTQVYGKNDSRSVTVDDVLAALYRLRDTGSPYPEEEVQ